MTKAKLVKQNKIPIMKQRVSVWWLNPLFPILLCASLCIIAFFQSETSYISQYNSKKWVGAYYLFICLVSLSICILGLYFGRNSYQKKQSTAVKKTNSGSLKVLRAFWFVTLLTFIAYGIWYIHFALIHGVWAFLDVFNSSALSEVQYVYRENSGSISGITTFTEAGIISAILGAYIVNAGNVTRRRKKQVYLALIFLFVLALFRSSLFSERLAIIELIVPFVVSWFFASKKPITRVDKWIPVVGIIALVIIFGVFEYSRSWLGHYSSFQTSFVDFVATRLFGYYTNALNTEAMFVQNGDTSWLPYWTIQWLWQIPGMNSLYSSLANPDINAEFSLLLANLANPEFNNPGGILTFFKDFSYFGLIFYFAFGYLIGKFYQGYKEGKIESLIAYALMYLTLLELPRYFFMGVNRGFIAVVCAFAVVFLFQLAQCRK